MKPFYCLILLLCFFNIQLMAQNVRIAGKVTATGGSPLHGVTVTSNGGSAGKVQTTTDARGVYAINVNADAKELVFTYVGMQPRTEIIRGRTTIDVQLSEASEQDGPGGSDSPWYQTGNKGTELFTTVNGCFHAYRSAYTQYRFLLVGADCRGAGYASLYQYRFGPVIIRGNNSITW